MVVLEKWLNGSLLFFTYLAIILSSGGGVGLTVRSSFHSYDLHLILIIIYRSINTNIRQWFSKAT